jgi:DNA-binding transcriptional regulator YiaG
MKNDVIKKMSAAQAKQAATIRKKSCYNRVSDEFDIEYQIARDLQRVRKRNHLTQSQLAERMGTTQSVVSRVEKGSNVSVETLARYAAACGAQLKVKIA